MSDPQVMVTLRAKRETIQAYIEGTEKLLKAARADLMNVNSVIALFERRDAPADFPLHMNLSRQFRRGEMPALAMAALEAATGQQDTRQIAAYVVAAKGFNPDDRMMRTTLTNMLVNVLRRMARQGRVAAEGKRSGVTVWRLALSAVRAAPALSVVSG